MAVLAGWWIDYVLYPPPDPDPHPFGYANGDAIRYADRDPFGYADADRDAFRHPHPLSHPDPDNDPDPQRDADPDASPVDYSFRVRGRFLRR